MANANDKDTEPVGGDRPPSDVDRPPVSRVGDELLERADDADATESDEDIEREAYDAAQRKGWDKSVKDS
jgi:hypothetical protein